MRIVDAWIQHFSPRILRHPMFASLLRWTGAELPDEIPFEMTLGALRLSADEAVDRRQREIDRPRLEVNERLRQIDGRERRIESACLGEVGVGALPILVLTMELGAAKPERRIGGLLGDRLREGGDPLVQVAVRTDFERQAREEADEGE